MGIRNFISKLRYRTGTADCSAYLELVQLVLDDESTKEQEVYLKRHFKICAHCFETFEAEKEFKELLKLKLENRKVPEGLADSIRAEIIKST